eukprot:1289442-Lingulodinium_polyedra.AAC.1
MLHGLGCALAVALGPGDHSLVASPFGHTIHGLAPPLGQPKDPSQPRPCPANLPFSCQLGYAIKVPGVHPPRPLRPPRCWQ